MSLQANIGIPAAVSRKPAVTILNVIQWLYRKYERWVPLFVFTFGFAWDTLTMTRVDSIADHIILITYSTAIGIMIALTLRRQADRPRPEWVCRFEPYFLPAMQFAFGGLFSSFVIFYFMSVSWTRTLFFFVILVVLLIGNEFLHHRLENPALLATLYSFCLISYLSLLLPTLFGSVATGVFLLAGILSVGITTSVFVLGTMGAWMVRWRQLRTVGLCVAAVYLIVNVLHFGNMIPPVPLALKSAGIYHKVAKTPSGYAVEYVAPPYYRFWKKWDDPFYLSPGEAVYCFTSIFAPRRIHVPVRHVWSVHNPGGWYVTDRVGFEISGGRDDGYRGFSRKRTLWPGRWRVEVETYQGRTLGRIDFTVVESPSPHPSLTARTIQ